jgi:hypothetical protein
MGSKNWTLLLCSCHDHNVLFKYVYRDIAGHERFGYMTRVYYKYA